MFQFFGLFLKEGFLQQQRNIFTTSELFGSPLRKKKRIDPLLLKKRTERKINRIQREIRKLEKSTKQLKPIVELELPPQIMREIDNRTRHELEGENRTHELEMKKAETELKVLFNFYAIYQSEQQRILTNSIKTMVNSQKKALYHLKMHSQQLYDAALSIDKDFLPYKVEQVRKETPPNHDYQPPDGKHQDVTKDWRM